MSSNRHSPNDLIRYLRIHDTVMKQFIDKGFIRKHTVHLLETGHSYAIMGEIACSGRLIISVHKVLCIVDGSNPRNPIVETTHYSYCVRLHGKHPLFRYDNANHWSTHPDWHHRHSFDLETGEEEPDSPKWIGAEKWLVLGDVIAEAQQFFNDRRSSWPFDESDYEIALNEFTGPR